MVAARYLPDAEAAIGTLIADSFRRPGGITGAGSFDSWLAECSQRLLMRVEPQPLAELAGWLTDPASGDLAHHTGGFFRVEGIAVHVPGATIEHWQQPIISQPEVGILGLLVKEFDGVLHCLLQAKAEPGNCNGLQLSPTVQATRSNYTGLHLGRSVPYLEYFRDLARHRVVADVRQSEQGAWFRHKRNRNMIVQTTDEVEPHPDFCWLTLGQVHALLRLDHLINMDTRTVLACLPIAGIDPDPGPSLAGLPVLGLDPDPPLAGLPAVGTDADPLPGRPWSPEAIVRSCQPRHGSRHSMTEILSWITGARTRHQVEAVPIPLRSVLGWRHVDGRISHERGLFFDVVGVRVEAVGREVQRWQQPMIAPHGTGLAAALVRQIDGVLHVLMHARVEPGYLDVLELAPSVQCNPETYDSLPPEARPPFLDEVLTAHPSRLLFDTVLSEEGGRFMHARTRYAVVTTDLEVPPALYPDHRWFTLHQLSALVQHSHYLNVQARSILACLHSLVVGRSWPAEPVTAGPPEVAREHPDRHCGEGVRP